MFDPNYKRIELAQFIVCQLPRNLTEAMAVLALASKLAPVILTAPEATTDQEKADP
ncbi:hypothetical protein [Bradyrhizobium liaoningense]|uniref:hypothetical protein n=1 Tax=Bradyrhizobium liaoningense TaxID=43992 RepID=UPI001BA9CCB1|nr:hypothetical protein [Bradyrhizobium liaoningense]